jgi:hypothetical protein
MKGIAINRGVLILLMIVSVALMSFTVSGQGPIGKALDSASDKITDSAASDGPVTQVSSKKELAGLGILTFDRAAECTWVENNRKEGKYSILQETNIGPRPQCQILPFGGIIRDRGGGLSDAATGSGNDVEGIDGRIRFNITQDMVIDIGEPIHSIGTEKIPLDTWDGPGDFRINAVSRTPYSKNVKEKCGSGYRTSRTSGNSNKNGFATYGYIMAFKNPDGFSQRYKPAENSRKIIDKKRRTTDFSGIYCTRATNQYLTKTSLAQRYRTMTNIEDAKDPGQIKLCEGDSGYIQTNKKKPTNDATRTDSGENLIGSTPLFAYIQIQETADNCIIDDPIKPMPENSKDFITSSDVLRVDANDDSYPGISGPPTKQSRFDLVQQSSEFENVQELRKIGNLGRQQCGLSIVERNPSLEGGSPQKRWLTYSKGTTVPRTGEAFPRKKNAKKISGSRQGFEGPAQNLYNNLRKKGINEKKLALGESNADLLLERESGHYFELYGPIMCGNANPQKQGSRAEWHLCITRSPKDSPKTEGRQISTDANPDYEFECTKEKGWTRISESTRFTETDSPENILYPSKIHKDRGIISTENGLISIDPSTDEESCSSTDCGTASRINEIDGFIWKDQKVPGGSKDFSLTVKPKQKPYFKIKLNLLDSPENGAYDQFEPIGTGQDAEPGVSAMIRFYRSDSGYKAKALAYDLDDELFESEPVEISSGEEVDLRLSVEGEGTENGVLEVSIQGNSVLEVRNPQFYNRMSLVSERHNPGALIGVESVSISRD